MAMRRGLFSSIFLAAFFISACSLTAGSASLPPTQPVTFLASEIPPSPSPMATQTPLPTITFSPFPTRTATETPTATAITFSYVFPLQPSEGTGFAEGTASHGYPATDIFAPVGTRFVAVTNGVVDFVSYEDTWDPAADDPSVRGGLAVAIIGDDGVRYYGSHLSAIADGISPGVRVTVGQLLGLVGRSGNARNTDSHLHFGISRPTTPDDWKARRGQVDPYPFLQAWLEGHNVTPPLPNP
jgi:murein DD-endopeptidase MepM/ murein hydrolase activator NlpD